jgi:23S rRNA C2498 (ribose-2'-O)-methylase RlmM
MIRLNSGIACDLGAAEGLWIWTLNEEWMQSKTANPGQMVAVDIDKDGMEELVVAFSGYGLYYHDENNGWQFLNAVVPEDMKPINFYP